MIGKLRHTHPVSPMPSGRPLVRAEIAALWSIDRSERIDRVYRLEKGRLELEPADHELAGWPPQNTVDFHLRSGCVLSREVDPRLFALEPNDIHLECDT